MARKSYGLCNHPGGCGDQLDHVERARWIRQRELRTVVRRCAVRTRSHPPGGSCEETGRKKIVLGECGHGHKASMVTADRLIAERPEYPRESAMSLLRDIVMSGRLKLDPSRNNFPVTLHDPCNMVRMMGIVRAAARDPARHLSAISRNDPARREELLLRRRLRLRGHVGIQLRRLAFSVAGRMKLKQILDAFRGLSRSPEMKKYVCAPCSNCKGQFRDFFEYYDVWERSGILYGGLAELIVNAMVDVKQPFIKWEFH